MKKIYILCIISYLLILSGPLSFAESVLEYPKFPGSDFEIPPEIKKVTNAKELRPFLESSRDFTRMTAVRRLSEIEGPNSIDSLISIYKKERPIVGPFERSPIVKLEVIRSLGRIATERAKNALLTMLKELWEKGPTLIEKYKEKKFFYFDCDFRDCTPLLLQILYKWSGDKEVSGLARKIANSEDVEKYYGYPFGIGQRAWEICIKTEMTEKGIIQETEIAKYLVNYEEEILEKGIDKPSVSLKRSAANEILVTINEETLSSLLKEAREEYRNSRDIKKLGTKIGILKSALEMKTERQKKAKVGITSHI